MSVAFRMLLGWTLCVLVISRESWAQQFIPANGPTQVQVTANAATGTNSAGPLGSSSNPAPKLANVATDELKRFEEYKRSPLFLEPFDPTVLSLPDQHLAYVRNVTRNSLTLYREILNEAISSRNKMATSVRLVLKYGGRMIKNIMRTRREEKQLPARVEAKPEFYLMIANISQAVADQSSRLKRNYSKKTIDIENFRLRVETLFDFIERTIEVSPLGHYLKWNQAVLYKDQPRNGVQSRPYVEEVTDLVAQFRAMGYESTSFFMRRLVNLLRLFARGVVPSSEKEI